MQEHSEIMRIIVGDAVTDYLIECENEMIPERSYLAYRDGFLCVAYQTTFSDKPELQTNYWPIEKMPLSMAEQFGLGNSLRDLKSDGLYYDPATRLEHHLKDGGRTMPIAITTVPLDRPKSGGKKLRWHYGRWQKLLKKGWVDLPLNWPDNGRAVSYTKRNGNLNE